VKQLERKDLLKFESVQNWFNSLESNKELKGKELSKTAKSMRLGRLWELTNKGEITPDELLAEAKEDIDKTGKRLNDYFVAKKKVTSHNTAHTSTGYLRGFYTHNKIMFPRSVKLPKKEESQIVTQDDKTALYDYDEETKEMVFKSEKIRYFLQNLSFRDQVIALCLLSSGADTKDLLKLNVGFVKDKEENICDKKRFFWRGQRSKTGTPFRTFFSAEATEYLKRYVRQERVNAKDDEPLFVGQKREYTISQGKHEGKRVEIDERLTVHAISSSFRLASKDIGKVTKKGESNPFRPKRFRRLFRSACSIAEVDVGYVKAMMGHTQDMSGTYLEKGAPFFKRVYVQVEPFLTVFTGADNETKKRNQELEKGITNNTLRTQELEAEVKDLKEQLKSATELVYSFEPVLTTFSTIADTKEGQELIKRIHEAKLQAEAVEAQEQTGKERDEITKEHPVPKKAKRE